MIYTGVLNRSGATVRSSIDRSCIVAAVVETTLAQTHKGGDMKRFWQGLTLLLVLAVYGVAQAQAPAYGNEVTLDMAKKVMAAAEAEAKKNNWPMVIAIVDTHGLLVMLQRIDNTQTASVEVAIEKARTAAMFKRPSKAFEDAVTGGRVAVLGLPGATPIEGGLLLVLDGKIIGAIGVSGMASPQDGQVAKAGADAVGK